MSFSELHLLMSSSLFPLNRISKVSGLIFFTAAPTLRSSILQCALVLTSFLSLGKMQRKRHSTRQLGIYFGEYCLETCLHRLLKSLNAESATIASAFPYNKDVAAPMLLPHRITRYPFSLKKAHTLAVCCDYRSPRLMVCSSSLAPHPMKSKQPRAIEEGRYCSSCIDSSRFDMFP